MPARDAAGAAGAVRVFLQADFTAKELSENYEAREQGRPLPYRAAGTIRVRDDRDNGTTGTWDLGPEPDRLPDPAPPQPRQRLEASPSWALACSRSDQPPDRADFGAPPQ